LKLVHFIFIVSNFLRNRSRQKNLRKFKLLTPDTVSNKKQFLTFFCRSIDLVVFPVDFRFCMKLHYNTFARFDDILEKFLRIFSTDNRTGVEQYLFRKWDIEVIYI